MMRITAPIRIDISAGWSDADPFRNHFGGAVLNGAIDLRVSGILTDKDLTTSLERAPANSGLGTSGALRSVFLVTSNPSLIKDKIGLINRVNVLENAIIGQRAGFQDQAAAIFGGVNYWEFKKNGEIIRKEISKKKADGLQDKLVLVFSGDVHVSGNVHERVFTGGNHRAFINEVKEMKLIAKKMVGDIDNVEKMTAYINRTWELQKMLDKNMETKDMKKIADAVEGDYLAYRATGAGGGGCMIFYTDKKDKLIRKLRGIKKSIKGMEILPFKFDYEGMRIEKR